MKIGMIGGGSVGQTLGKGLIAAGHDVMIGVRDPGHETMRKARNFTGTLGDWAAETGGQVGAFADAAAFGTVIFNVTAGLVSIEALARAGAANLDGKVLVDVANPLDFSQGMPPFLPADLSVHTSLGEEIQKAFPGARVVKAFNTVGAAVMVNPGLISAPHDLFIAGNDAAAKATVTALARDAFGWSSVRDLGDIVGARAMEHLLPLWLRQWMTGGNPTVNIRIAEG
jgi:8-hydroxy-5-deazaflavin:NADPH oxidoreductase